MAVKHNLLGGGNNLNHPFNEVQVSEHSKSTVDFVGEGQQSRVFSHHTIHNYIVILRVSITIWPGTTVGN